MTPPRRTTDRRPAPPVLPAVLIALGLLRRDPGRHRPGRTGPNTLPPLTGRRGD